ncbi:MAG: putative NEK protein kinase, partial [Streblomastix strix]
MKLQKLGKGQSGDVHLHKELTTGKLVAIKKMDYGTKQEKELVTKKITIMRKIFNLLRNKSSSPFLPVVEPLGFFQNEGKVKAFLVMEYCHNGDLKKYIDNIKKSQTKITPQLASEIFAQMAFSMNQLHANGIMHNVLKPEKVLLTENYKVKLLDFGLAQQLQIGLFQPPEFLRYERKDDKEKEITFGITIEKQQEVISRPIQTPAVDIWSFGVMIFQLLAQHHPFFDDKTEANISAGEFIYRVVNLQPAELPDHYPLKLKNLMK